MKNELYFSLDIETDGPIPGMHSMRQVALVAFDMERCPIDAFKANLLPANGACQDEVVMLWWRGDAERWKQWEAIQVGAEHPGAVMPRLSQWVRNLCATEKAEPICCASPAGFDFTFLRSYLIRYDEVGSNGECVFGHRCWDARSHAMGILGKGYLESGKSGIPENWRPKDLPHTHDALDDALEQAFQFQNQMKASREQCKAANAWGSFGHIVKALTAQYETTKTFLMETMK